jgi:hypothetical protein
MTLIANQIQLGQTASASKGSGLAVNVTLGAQPKQDSILVMAVCTTGSASLDSVSQTGVTWTNLGTAVGTGVQIELAIGENIQPGAGTVATVTIDGTDDLVAVVAEFEGAVDAFKDDEAAFTNNSGIGTSAITTSDTPTNPKVLEMAVVGVVDNVTLSAPTNGYSIAIQQNSPGEADLTAAVLYGIGGSGLGASSTSVTISLSRNWATRQGFYELEEYNELDSDGIDGQSAVSSAELEADAEFSADPIAAQSSLSGQMEILPSEQAIPDIPREGFSGGGKVQDFVALVARGDPGANNKVEINGPSELKLIAGAPSINLGTPPSTSPVRIGFLPGDKIKLFGTGSEPNHLKVYTFSNPNNIETVEEIEDYDTDTNQYEYEATRRK